MFFNFLLLNYYYYIYYYYKLNRAYANVSDSLNRVDIFDSDVGIYSLQYAWKAFGRRVHLKEMLKNFIYILFFTFSCFLFDFNNEANRSELVYLTWLLQVFIY